MKGNSALRWLNSILPAIIFAVGLMVGSAVSTARAAGPGPEVCKNCHADKFESYQASKHSTKSDRRTPANAGACSTCHGDGTEHVKAGGGKGVGGIVNPGSKTLAADAKNSICLTCHQGGKRINWQMSLHASRDTACTSCHQVHTAHDKVRDKREQAEVCFACHKEQRAQVNKPSRHPIPEGKVTCSDCHNPHGSAGPKNMVRDNVNDTCYTCHMEKRGPFVRTHQPVQEDCSICHNPHGTTTPNLLKQRAPFLCESCHEASSHQGSVASLSNISSTGANTIGRGCLNCHTQIHGTNNPSSVGNQRTFRR
jgi:DmsE family decaheme c-type cytochrome